MRIEYLNFNNSDWSFLNSQRFSLFTADLHLSSNKPEITEKFLYFLKTIVIKAEALYILGDLFVIWAGDDDKSDLAQKIKIALHEVVEKGVKIFLMPGNRDFLLSNDFARASGCEILKDPIVIDLYGVPTLLTHGDLLCGKDSIYIHFRNLTRDTRRQKLFLRLPFFMRKSLALMIHNLSCAKNSLCSKEEMKKLVQQEAINLMQQYKVTQIIHGHIHLPFMKETLINEKTMNQIVLGDWNDKKEYSNFEALMVSI